MSNENYNIPVREPQNEREARCHKECEDYFSLIPMTDKEREWFHRGVNSGAKWVDSGDKIII